MVKVNDFEKVREMIDKVEVDKVYPLSIMEGIQQGEIFADNEENPKVVLFWHYSGFAYIAGECDIEVLHKIVEMMHNPRPCHSGRLALQTGNDNVIRDWFEKNTKIQMEQQYLFEFATMNKEVPILPDGYELKRIDESNYELLKGRIVPAFSWKTKELFLQKGYGYGIMFQNQFVSCAFSAGISHEYVDIGIETSENYRGMGLAKIVSTAMIQEICNRGQIPVWECNVRNKASKRLACAIGFEVKGIHPLYML